MVISLLNVHIMAPNGTVTCFELLKYLLKS